MMEFKPLEKKPLLQTRMPTPAFDHKAQDIPCCGPSARRNLPLPPIGSLSFVIGEVGTPAGPVPRISAALTRQDRLGAVKARWNINRMFYALPPGLYALGEPDADAPVLVSANYKLSFDKLREVLPGRSAWILVLDTDGINVWCAAGKGTFGTDELVKQVKHARLSEIVAHRKLILPQLGAPGVAGYKVRQHTGFKVVYGPVLAADLPAFLDGGLKATAEMRRKSFDLKERIVLIPVELVQALKAAIPLALIFFFLGGLGGTGSYWAGAEHSGLLGLAAIFGAVLGGAVFFQILLPWLPGRAFSLKAVPLGALIGLGLPLLWHGGLPALWAGRLELAAWGLMVTALTSFLAMNFTGASTYTSLSGVRKEMGWAVPLQITAAVLGLGLWIAARFVS